MQTTLSSGGLALIGISAAVLCALIIMIVKPLLVRYALAQPNTRSSHTVPTPQGGGAAVVGATIVIVAASVLMLPNIGGATSAQYYSLFAAVVVLAIVGCIDDIRTIDVAPRLLLQSIAAVLVVAILPGDLRIAPAIPIWFERVLLVVTSVWFINLVNFMDGIDWMTVLEVVTITIGIGLIALADTLPDFSLVVAVALLGATSGFAPFNRPIAKLFLGDVGSLPIGLLLFWLLLQLAGRGHVCAALLLPLYYLADTTITLLRRLAKGERITQAHRSHFYQRATERGLSVPAVLVRVAAANAVLVALAIVSVRMNSVVGNIATLLLGGATVATLLIILSRGRP